MTNGVQTKESQESMTPEAALEQLKIGNNRFLTQTTLIKDYHLQVSATASAQHPFAVILSCMDSRIPTEIIFDQGIGDVFNLRIAGNILNEDILGSLEFGCKIVGAKLILVLGHTSCGAIKGACDRAQLGNLTQMLNKITPVISTTETPRDEDRSSQNLDFVNRVASNNVNYTCREILRRSQVLEPLWVSGELGVVGAMYDVQSGKVAISDSNFNR